MYATKQTSPEFCAETFQIYMINIATKMRQKKQGQLLFMCLFLTCESKLQPDIITHCLFNLLKHERVKYSREENARGKVIHSSSLGQEPQGNSYIAAVPWHSVNPSIVDTFCSATSLLPTCEVPSAEFREADTLSSLKDSGSGCLWLKYHQMHFVNSLCYLMNSQHTLQLSLWKVFAEFIVTDVRLFDGINKFTYHFNWKFILQVIKSEWGTTHWREGQCFWI